MTPKQIKLVQDSWAKVVPIEAHAAALFYYKLSQLDPALKALNDDAMAEQKRKLMTTITVAVNGLTRSDAALPPAESSMDYTPVGTALLWTLGHGFGPAFDSELKEAWTAAYTVLAPTLRQGAAA
jgi:hemoglobin-like flavoprotein